VSAQIVAPISTPDVAAPEIVQGTPRRGPTARAWRSLRRNPVAMASLAFLVVVHLTAFLGPVVCTISPEEIFPLPKFSPPSSVHLLGIDESGRDVFARMLHGGRVSLGVGLASVVLSVVLGCLVGAVGGYFRGWQENVLMRFTDALMALPTFFLLLIVLAIFGGGVTTLTVVIGLTSWMGVARLVRSEVLRWREREFVEAARALGATDQRIIILHLLPQAIPSIIVASTLGVAAAILSEAAMSYLGLGIAPPAASWGNLLMNAQNYLYAAPRLAVFPGLMILLTVLAYNSLGDGLRDALDPEANT
jgi:peptide/nickel transport system permease protein